MSTLIKDKTTGDWKQVTSKYIDVPVGAIVAFMNVTAPKGWLICDGSTFDKDVYPVLYEVLGNNTLPDLRECILVGAGYNNTNIIATHDEYSVGQFKDDQIQNITGTTIRSLGNGAGVFKTVENSGLYARNALNGIVENSRHDQRFDASRVARAGTTTHGKQKGVNYIVRAA